MKLFILLLSDKWLCISKYLCSLSVLWHITNLMQIPS